MLLIQAPLWCAVKHCFTSKRCLKCECNPYTKPHSFPPCFHSSQQDCNFPFRSDKHSLVCWRINDYNDPKLSAINPSNPCCWDWLFTKSRSHLDTFHLVIKLSFLKTFATFTSFINFFNQHCVHFLKIWPRLKINKSYQCSETREKEYKSRSRLI